MTTEAVDRAIRPIGAWGAGPLGKFHSVKVSAFGNVWWVNFDSGFFPVPFLCLVLFG